MAFSNFYNDFSITNSDFNDLLDSYQETFGKLNIHALSTKNAIIIPKIGAYKNFPVHRIDITEAKYSVSSLLDLPKVYKKLNLEGYTLQQKIDMWNNNEISLSEKIEALNLDGRYILLTTERGISGEVQGKVVDMVMENYITTEPYIVNVDFTLKNNKLYLFGDIAALSNATKYAIAKNIFIDYNDIDNLIGSRVHIPYTDKLTKTEYAEISMMVLRGALGGPTINNILASVRSITGFDEVDIYDKFVNDTVKNSRWNSKTISPFSFIVSFPETYVQDIDRLSIMVDYLRLVKPAYTNFFIILRSEYTDLYNRISEADDNYNLDTISDGALHGRTNNEHWLTNYNFYAEVVANGIDEIYNIIDNTTIDYIPDCIKETLNDEYLIDIEEDENSANIIEFQNEEYEKLNINTYSLDTLIQTDDINEVFTNPISDDEIDTTIESLEDTYTISPTYGASTTIFSTLTGGITLDPLFKTNFNMKTSDGTPQELIIDVLPY